jgi:hypothetical protein
VESALSREDNANQSTIGENKMSKLTAIIFTGVALLFLASPVRSSCQDPTPDRPIEIARSYGNITKKVLLENKWRLYGVFQVLPMNGFPISFYSDGVVETQNLGGALYWRIRSGRLELLDQYRHVSLSFDYDERYRMLYIPTKKAGDSTEYMIGPEDADFSGYRTPLDAYRAPSDR